MKFTSFVLGLLIATSTLANEAMVTNGVHLKLTDKKATVVRKLGKPLFDDGTTAGWVLKNGNILYATFDNYGAYQFDLVKSPDGKNSDDRIEVDGKTIYLDKDNLNSVKSKLVYGCFVRQYNTKVNLSFNYRTNAEGSVIVIADSIGKVDNLPILKTKHLNHLGLGYDGSNGEELGCQY